MDRENKSMRNFWGFKLTNVAIGGRDTFLVFRLNMKLRT